MTKVSSVVSSTIGSYLTNVKTWGGVMYNVLEEGLVGGGVVDDTAALQTLIDKAIAAGRRTIYFPHGDNGQYYVTSLTNADQVDFVGDNCVFVGGYTGAIANFGGIAALQADFTQLEANTTSRGINVKYPPVPLVAALGDGGTEDSAALQNIFNYAASNNLKVIIPPSTYKCAAAGLVIDGDIAVEGDRSGTILDFTGLASGTCLTVGNLNAITDLVVSGFQIKGNVNVDGILLNKNGDINKPVVDSAFRDILVHGCKFGMKASYSWCNLFENIRFQNCTTSASLGAQFNHNLFSRVSFVTNNRCVILNNVEGVHFDSCEFANITEFGLTLFQSQVTITNPYVETAPTFAYVGASSETYPSSLDIRGGIFGGPIYISNNNSKINIENVRVNSNGAGKIVIRNFNETAPNFYTKAISLSNNLSGNEIPSSVVEWYGNTPIPYPPAFGGDTRSAVLDRGGFSKVTASNGINIAQGLLVTGEQYTLIYSIRKPAAVALTMRHTSTLGFNGAQADTEPVFELRYIPFVALGADLRLHWNGTIDIACLSIVKGLPTRQIDFMDKRLFATAAPTSGTWVAGDKVYNSSPTAGGFEGWICTTGGTPGTWKTFGAITA